ncbi:MAG: RDD family protein [Candidatus Nanopelagicales bacterium]
MAMTPGWYPDPFSSAGYVRWWDGAKWGASVLLPEGTPPPAPGQPVALPPPGQAPAASAASAAPPAQVPPPGYPSQGWAPPTAPPYSAPVAGRYGAPAGQAAPYEIASYGSRAAARIVDWIIEGVVIVPVSLWLLWPALTRFFEGIPADGTLPPDVLQQWVADVTGVSLLLTLVTLVVTFVYEVPQYVLYGRTVGKRLLGIRVRPRDIDSPTLTWGTSIIRWAVESGGAALVGGVFSIVDYLWPLWDKPWRQTIHDKAAKTTVVPGPRR